ncbi:hypothetical protein HA402_003097 [Bradysia odoriphaga]|nr:hypothetical protein HA402_003097 [Bradysia odoriphaga]
MANKENIPPLSRSSKSLSLLELAKAWHNQREKLRLKFNEELADYKYANEISIDDELVLAEIDAFFQKTHDKWERAINKYKSFLPTQVLNRAVKLAKAHLKNISKILGDIINLQQAGRRGRPYNEFIILNFLDETNKKFKQERKNIVDEMKMYGDRRSIRL